jgi:endothelin-converting enzyme/putative endopeptidase
MIALQTIFGKTNVDAWKEYKMELLNSATSLLSTYQAGKFDFMVKRLTGAIKQRPREDRALQNQCARSFRRIICRKKFPAEPKKSRR